MNLNKVILVGRLTRDPELRSLPSGQDVATLGIATNRVWTDKNGQRQEETEYHTVVVWGRQAGIANQFLKKGGMVLIEGRIRTRSWQDAQGQTRKTTEIVSERLQLGPRSTSGGGAGPSRGTQAADALPREDVPVVEIEDGGAGAPSQPADDLPF